MKRAQRLDCAVAIFVAAWAVAAVVPLLSRPLLPIDETRYLSVAWEMWLRHDVLVPDLNGAPYSDKPPFVFWVFLAGWSALGVNEWWPRIVPPLFALAGLVLTRHLARRLWPGDESVARLAHWFSWGRRCTRSSPAWSCSTCRSSSAFWSRCRGSSTRPRAAATEGGSSSL